MVLSSFTRTCRYPLLLSLTGYLWAVVALADCPPNRANAPVAAASNAIVPSPDLHAPVEISSDGATLDPQGNTQLSGHVQVSQAGRALDAETATYDALSGAIGARGNVRYQTPKVTLTGVAGTWTQTGAADFQEGEFVLGQGQARGHAKDITLAPNGALTLSRVSFTACPAGRDDWQIKASSLDIDRAANVGTAHNMELDFLGVPILYAPMLSFPVSDERKSGFLVPVPNHSGRNGFELSVPYYFNLAPNYDATLSLGEMTARGPTVGGEFRYLTQNSRGSLALDSVAADSQTGNSRGYLRLQNRTDFGSQLRLNLNASAISDSRYFEDFSQGPEGSSLSYLPRQAQLTYLDGNWRAIALVEQFQTVDLSVAPLSRPYTRLPDLSVMGRWRLPAHFEGLLDAEAVYFTRENSTNGGRLSVLPSLRYVWRQPGAFVIPSLSYQLLGYSLSNNLNGSMALPDRVEHSPIVNAPTLGLDSGLVFERNRGTLLSTLEPRVLYTYTPYRNQSALPLFDTALPDFNIVQLFRSTRYVGGDRIADANQLASGVTTRLIQASNGEELLNATLGNIYYFSKPRITLPGEAASTNPTSDVVADVILHTFSHWNIELGEAWAPQSSHAERTEIGVQYRRSGEQVVNLAYRFRRDLLSQVEGSAAWPLTPSWQVVARQVYSTKDHASIDTVFGLQYRSCCWKVRVVARRDIVTRPTDLTQLVGSSDTSIALELELNGLAAVGSSANTFLRTAIRGYSPTVGRNPLAD